MCVSNEKVIRGKQNFKHKLVTTPDVCPPKFHQSISLNFRRKIWLITTTLHCTLNSFGNTSAGCPLTTNNLEFNFLKLESKSSKHCSKNLKTERTIMMRSFINKIWCFFHYNTLLSYNNFLQLMEDFLIPIVIQLPVWQWNVKDLCTCSMLVSTGKLLKAIITY